MLKAVISPGWAEQLRGIDVWQFNTYSAESLLTEVDVREFGGLAVALATPRIADSEVIANAKSTRDIIDLAFGSPAVETHTGLLLRASHDAYGPDYKLTSQLAARNFPTSEHGSDESWFLPLTGVEIIDVATSRVRQ